MSRTSYVSTIRTRGESTVEMVETHQEYTTGYFWSQTENTYDENHNLIKTISGINPNAGSTPPPEDVSLDLTTYIEHDGFGNLIRSTDARGNSSSHFYNQFGAMIRSANALGSVSLQTWDETSTRLLSSTDPTGSTTEYSYSPIGQLIATKDAAGNVSKTQYDPNGNVICQANAKGYSGQMFYDNRNRLYKTISPSVVVRNIELSKIGQVTKEETVYWDEDYSTPEQHVYRRTFYDQAGRVTSRSLPDNSDHGVVASDWESANKLATKYTYDEDGRVIDTTDRYGGINENSYDELGRLSTTQPPDIPSTTSGNIIRTLYKKLYAGPAGRVSEEQVQEEHSSDGGTTWSVDRSYYFIKKYTYDRAGRVIVEQLPQHTMIDDEGVLHYYDAFADKFYDENGNVIQSQLRQEETSPGTGEYTFPSYSEFDLANRLVKESKLVSTDDTTYDRIENTHEYDPAGRQTSVNKGGLLIQTTYDSAGRVASVRKTSGCGCGGGCKGGGGVASVAGTSNQTSNEADPVDLWEYYNYDETGNRITYSDASGVFSSVTYDCENRPVASTDRAGHVTKTDYWPTGQVKRKTGPDGNFIAYEYDIEGRTIRVWESIPELNPDQTQGLSEERRM